MKSENINNQRMKEINTRNLLSILRKHEPISRKELVKLSGLTAGTVTNLISDLVDQKILNEVGSGVSQGGRRPVFLELNADAGYAIGLELTTNQICCLLSDFKAQVLATEYAVVDAQAPSETIIDQIILVVENIIKKASINKDKILGLGLAIPGPCNYEEGILLTPPNFPHMFHVPIKKILQERLGIQVFASKETSCCALSEYWFGEAAGVHRILGIHIGEVGVGGALVLDGVIFEEKEGESLDIGHTTVQLDGPLCSCGNRGCVELYVQGRAAVAHAKEALKRGQVLSSLKLDEVDLDSLTQGAQVGDKVCIEAITHCAYYLSAAVANILCLLSPQRIYFGGRFITKSPLLFEKTVEFIERRDYPASAKASYKARFTFGDQSGAMGGLALVFNQLLK